LTVRFVSRNLPFVQTYQGAVFEALADPTRRGIFELVAARSRSVADLASLVPVSRPAVSQHLKVLRQARLVKSTPLGTKRIYALDPQGVTDVQAYFEQFWTSQLTAFAQHVQETT
jgi:DNA-binding transcriptional ArsR family regulator